MADFRARSRLRLTDTSAGCGLLIVQLGEYSIFWVYILQHPAFPYHEIFHIYQQLKALLGQLLLDAYTVHCEAENDILGLCHCKADGHMLVLVLLEESLRFTSSTL